MEAMANKKQKQLEFDRFCLKGDFYHNLKLFKSKEELKVLRRPGAVKQYHTNSLFHAPNV